MEQDDRGLGREVAGVDHDGESEPGEPHQGAQRGARRREARATDRVLRAAGERRSEVAAHPPYRHRCGADAGTAQEAHRGPEDDDQVCGGAEVVVRCVRVSSFRGWRALAP